MIQQAILLAGEPALTRVAGLSLVGRAALGLGRNGFTSIVVVAADPAVRARISADAGVVRAGAKVAAEPPSGRALWVSCDQVFDPGIAKKLAATAGAGVTSARKGAEDLGIAAGGDELAASVRQTGDLRASLAALGAQPVDAGAALWRRVNGPADANEARKTLFRSLRKPTDGPVSKWFNRYQSLAVTRLVLDTSITPNQMTVVANLIGVIGVWLVFRSTWMSVIAGSFLVQMQSVLDGCDGEIARLKYQSSRFGEWFDNVLDDHVNVAFVVALGYASWKLRDEELWLWLGIGQAVAMTIYNATLYAQLAFVRKSGNPFHFRWWFQKDGADLQEAFSRPSAGARVAGAFRSLARRDVFVFAFFLLCVVHLPHVAVAWAAIMAAGYLVLTILHLAAGGAPDVAKATK